MSTAKQRTIHGRNHAYELVCGRYVADLIREDPGLLDLARAGLARMKTRPNLADAVRIWESLLTEGPRHVANIPARDGALGDYVRETKPYFVALDDETTKQLLAEARKLF